MVAFLYCWCHASRTKGGAKQKQTPCNLLCLLWQSRPSQLFLLPFCFLTLPLFFPFFLKFFFLFCLHAALICISPWCDVLMERMATRCVCQKNLIQSTDLASEVKMLRFLLTPLGCPSLVTPPPSLPPPMEELFACTSFYGG